MAHISQIMALAFRGKLSNPSELFRLRWEAALCEDRIGTGPPRTRTEVIHVDLGHWTVSSWIHPEGDPISWGINSSVVKEGGFWREGSGDLWFMVYGLWFMVYGVWFMVYGLWFMVYGLWFRV